MVGTPWRLLSPRRPDPTVRAGITDAGMPQARGSVRLTALRQASMSAPTFVVAEGSSGPLRLPLGMTTFLVEHPEARFLVDPALCADVHARMLPELPTPFRLTVAPQKPIVSMTAALRRCGMRPEDVDFAVPTHLHWDHVCGLAELPGDLPVRVLPGERAFAGQLGDTKAPPLGVIRSVLRGRNFETYELGGPPVLTFERSHDVFGDGTVVLVSLPGHTPGSVGVLLRVEGGSKVLLAGDAAWHGKQVTALRQKAPFPGELVDADRDEAFATLHRLHALPRDITVVPAHDPSAAAPWIRC
jgi:glyoxylase-like metal-dependent hydrolase (beta-lactamase superfamily II)